MLKLIFVAGISILRYKSRMDTVFQSIITLRSMLHDMENRVGLADLPDNQRNLYLAAQDCLTDGDIVTTASLMSHSFIKSMSRPTFFRTLKALEERGLIVNSGRKKTGEFVLGTIS